MESFTFFELPTGKVHMIIRVPLKTKERPRNHGGRGRYGLRNVLHAMDTDLKLEAGDDCLDL
jgi:hypothetical protein